MTQYYSLAFAQEEDLRRVPRNRIKSSGSNAFNLSDEDFICNFRLNKTVAFQLIEELKPFLDPKTTRKTALNTEIKVLCALSFFGYGCYQRKIGNDFLIMVSKASVSNCIRDVSKAMSQNLLQKYVKFPDDQSSQKALNEQFFDYCGLGGVLGAIDCTHVAIVGPPDDGFHHEKNYVNRKGWHSINVQLICDMNMCISNVVARFPGCTHDAFIWQSCKLKQVFHSGRMIHGDGWLLGDSGYPKEPHLHTPFLTVSPGSAEKEYNNAHSRGRCAIERCNGVLKNRFRCLLKHRTLHYMPDVAGRIINSCVILHNLCIEGEIEWEDIDLPEEDQLFNTVND